MCLIRSHFAPETLHRLPDTTGRMTLLGSPVAQVVAMREGGEITTAARRLHMGSNRGLVATRRGLGRAGTRDSLGHGLLLP